METFKVQGGELQLRVRGNGSPLILVLVAEGLNAFLIRHTPRPRY